MIWSVSSTFVFKWQWFVFFFQTGKNLPRYNQMNINVATWARIIKRSQPNEHQHSTSSSLSSGGSVVRPSSLSSSTRPLPLNLITSPASISLPPASTSSNCSPPPQLETHSAEAQQHVSSPQENNSHKQLELTVSEKPQNYHHPHHHAQPHPAAHAGVSSGMAGTSMARPLSLSLSSPIVPMPLSSGGGANVVTSPVTPTALTSTVVPIQFPPSGKKPAPPPPPRTTSVVTIGHTTPVQPSAQPPQPGPRTYHHTTTPSDTVEEVKVRANRHFLFIYLCISSSSSSSCFHFSLFLCPLPPFLFFSCVHIFCLNWKGEFFSSVLVQHDTAFWGGGDLFGFGWLYEYMRYDDINSTQIEDWILFCFVLFFFFKPSHYY